MTFNAAVASADVPESLAWRGLDLFGKSAIEASAGTGKTYTLVLLVVRILLERELGLSAILLATFTEAATSELRARVRERIQQAYAASLAESDVRFLPLDATDPLSEYLAARWQHDRAGAKLSVRSRDCALLARALGQIEEMPIRTLHGFARQLLVSFNLTPNDLDAKIIDGDVLTKAAIDNAIRRRFTDVARLTPILLDALDAGFLAQLRRAVERVLRYGRITLRAPVRIDAGQYQRLRAALFQPEFRGALHDVIAQNPDDLKLLLAARRALETLARALKLGPSQALPIAALRVFNGEKSAQFKSARRTLASHPALAMVQRFAALQALAARAEFAQLLNELVPEVRAARAATLSNQGAQSFDSMIESLADQLAPSDADAGALRAAQALCGAIHERYPVALIDEFQDTDAQSWAILQAIYATRGGLVLVGDPKQSIYRFRGSDVHTFVRAAQICKRFYLQENYRSSAALIAGLNAFYAAVPQPFLSDVVRYRAAVVGRSSTTISDANAAALTFVELQSDGDIRPDLPACLRAASVDIAELIAQFHTTAPALALPSIAMLLARNQDVRAASSYLAECGVAAFASAGSGVYQSPAAAVLLTVLEAIAQPTDLARARTAQLALGQARAETAPMLPSCTRLDQALARQLEVLALHLHTRGIAYLCLGLSSGLGLVPGTSLAEQVTRSTSLAEQATRSTSLAEQATRSTSLAGRRHGKTSLAEQATRSTSLAGRRHGKTSATEGQLVGKNPANDIFDAQFQRDAVHLAELMAHEERALFPARIMASSASESSAVECQLHAGKLAVILRAHQHTFDDRADSAQRRRTGLGAGVQVMTIHKAKGLEFDHVFLPTLYFARTPDPLLAIIPGANGLECDAGSAQFDTAIAAEADEALGELLRQQYVALTRAKTSVRVYFCNALLRKPSALSWHLSKVSSAVSGPVRGAAELAAELTAELAWADQINAPPPAILGADGGSEAADASADEPADKPADKFWRVGLNQLVEHAQIAHVSPSRLAIDATLQAAQTPTTSQGNATLSLAFNRSNPLPILSPMLRRISFSTLTQIRQLGDADMDFRTNAFDVELGAPDVDVIADALSADPILVALEKFKGANFGLALHALFEDAMRTTLAIDCADVYARCVEFGVLPAVTQADDAQAIVDLIARNRQAALLPGVSLAQLNQSSCIAELGFQFPVNSLLVDALAALGPRFGLPPLFMPNHELECIHGMLIGFIDLVFQDGEKFYLLDYKSNWLGPQLQDYQHTALATSMAEHHYHLQHLLYALALHRYLRQSLAGYDYETNFGGAHYLFVRAFGLAEPGFSEPASLARSALGHYLYRAPLALIEALDQLFTGLD